MRSRVGMQDRVSRLCIVALILMPCVGRLARAQDRMLVSSSRLVFGTDTEFSASVRAGDLDGDGDLDLVIANGRHWPQQNYLLMNGGRARFSIVRPLGLDQCTSYAAEPIDVDGDGDLDIVTGNAMAPCQLFINDGNAEFAVGEPLSVISSVRSLTISDLNGDGHQDVIATSRGMPNLAHLNDGNGGLNQVVQFGATDDSTIDVAIADFNRDGAQDLALANRDAQRNQLLMQSPSLHFKASPLGGMREQSRAIAVADMNGDGNLDCVIGNIGSPNRIHFGDAAGGFSTEVSFGAEGRQTYAIVASDIDQDGDVDLVSAVVGGQNVVYFNEGDGKTFLERSFGDALNATYGLCVADLDGDGFADVAVANSGAQNRIFLNRPSRQSSQPVTGPVGDQSEKVAADASTRTAMNASQKNSQRLSQQLSSRDWPQFRGTGGIGVAEGFSLAKSWNADREDEIEDSGILWRQAIPGLSHSSPVINGDRLYVSTAIAMDGEAPLKVGRSGAADAAEDNGVQQWKVLCLEKKSGALIWERTCRTGQPKVTRHAKATHANTTLTIAGDQIYAFFGSEGLYCLDLDGDVLWERDLGVINISKYGIGWGYASSPAVFGDNLVLVCDDPQKPYLVSLDAKTGEEKWRVSREGETERNWSTPFIFHSDSQKEAQVIINGWPSVISYNLSDGTERWRIRGGGDNPVPTPFAIDELIYLTSSHGSESPIHVVHAGALGDLTDRRSTAPNDAFAWSVDRGGSYMSTPVVYEGLLYLGNSNGVLRCFDAFTGEKLYEERLGSGASVIASLVAGDGKVYCASENGRVYVVKAGKEYQLLTTNSMGSPCYASPAISEGVIYFRTTRELIAVE